MSRSPDPAVRKAWQARLQRYERSQFTVAEFCRGEDVSPANFYQWRNKLRGEAAVSPRAAQPINAQFVPLVVTGSPASAAKLQLPGGATVELPVSLEREQLTELFAACIAATRETAGAEVQR